MTRRYPPMLVTKADVLPVGPDWSYELKFDGYRMMGEIAASEEVRRPVFTTRGGHDYTRRYPAAARAFVQAFGDRPLVVDGEMVGFDAAGHIDFNELSRRNPRVAYCIFDLLEDNGESLIELPLSERRERLRQRYARPLPEVPLVDIFDDRDSLVSAVAALSLEGVIAKRTNSRYIPGRRSKLWLKHILNPHVVKAWR